MRQLETEQLRGVCAEHRVLLGRGQERAVVAHIVDTLPVGAEALDIRHVGAPDQLAGAEQIAHLADQLLRLGVGVFPDPAPGDREHDLDQQIVALVGGKHLGREIPFAAAGEMRDRRPHHQHEAQRRMALHQAVERHQVRDVARLVVVRRRRQLDEGRQSPCRDPVPERPEGIMVEIALVAVTREVVRVVEALQPERTRTVDFGEHVGAVRHRLVDVQQAGESSGKASA